MKKFLLTPFFIGLTLLSITNCKMEKREITTQDDFPPAPVAQKIPVTFTEFSNTRVDNYYWMRDKEDPNVIEYLNLENEYTQTVMASTKDLQESIYNEILGRIKEDDQSYPTYMNGYYYYSKSEAGKQYRVFCRKKGSLDAPEEIIFDVNQMAEGHRAFRFAGYSISPDNNLAAFSFNTTGSFADNIIKVKNLNTGEYLQTNIPMASSFTWANDNKTIFYTIVDNALRPYRVYRHNIESPNKDTFIYEEKDARFNTYVYKSKTNNYIFIGSNSTYTSELQYIDANMPLQQFKIFLPRVEGVEYSVNHHKDKFFIRYKDKDNLNGVIYTAPLDGFQDRANWSTFLGHNPNVRIEGMDVSEKFLSVELRENGLNNIVVYNLIDNSSQSINFPEPVYSIYLMGNPEYQSNTIRYNYTSLNRPSTLYEYNMESQETTKLKEQEVPSGFNPDDYTVERLWAESHDGTLVPMAIVYKKGLRKNGKNPALLYSYGSYGYSSDVFFSPALYSLIDRGFVYAIAQIRGGSDLGEQWYEDGKLLNKKNTFKDFIACAQKLIDDRYTSSDRLAAMGGSAGGLLMGAVVNMRPELFQTIVAQVPFVDVINTMLDTSLPLTTQEYEEWGDPNIEEYYNYILSYSPYDNITKQDYPNILATSGLNDSQVGFHEPTKWVAKLRDYKTDNNIVLLYTNMDSGHGGATGRYDRIKETAFEFAFILDRVGIKK